MLSMTGFGNGEGHSGPVTITVEMRSVNHRFLDVSLKLPGTLSFLEADIREFLKNNVARGRVTVSAQMSLERNESTLTVDADRLTNGIKALQDAAAELENATGKSAEISLDHILQIPDLYSTNDTEFSTDELREAFMAAVRASHAGLMDMKKAEGEKLVAEMNSRLDTLAGLLAEVQVLAPQAADEIHARLVERVQKLTNDVVDPQRLAQEVAFLADRANINEECERLAIHIEHFRNAIVEGGQVAKRLNFLLQEMHREVNTMGSKTNLMDITTAVIGMKDEVESMREQIQNLE